MLQQKPRVVLATENRHKLREIAAMLADDSFSLVSLRDFPDVTLPPETGLTFEENAVIKALAAAKATGLAAIGDDSGLEVDALGGEPGVFSARYSGAGATDARNLELVMEKLRDVPDERRTARFVCSIAVARPDGSLQTVRGICEGWLTRTPRGQNGFGYDPIFQIPGDGRTLAEFSPEEKNRISHRSRAVAAARPLILAALRHY